MEVTTVRPLLADPPTSRISSTYNQRMRSRRNFTYRQTIILHRETLTRIFKEIIMEGAQAYGINHLLLFSLQR
jgi:hypothetical protein